MEAGASPPAAETRHFLSLGWDPDVYVGSQWIRGILTLDLWIVCQKVTVSDCFKFLDLLLLFFYFFLLCSVFFFANTIASGCIFVHA